MKTTKHKTTNAISIVMGILIIGIITTCCASAATPIANEFWISTNATANFYPSAAGTIDSPLDGSTQANFDYNMNSLPKNSTIHILAGTYQTFGNNAYIGGTGWFAKSGQKIIGSGIDVTVLKLVSNAPDETVVICSSSSVAVTNIEISDLTCDANYSSGSYTYIGVDLHGTRNAVRRVKVINLPKFGGNSEAWGIVISNGGLSLSEGNIIEECEVSKFAGGSAISAISFNGGGPGTFESGIIRNNRVFLPTDGNDMAINGSCTRDVLIEGNYVNGAAVGYYGDTGSTENTIVTHNTFRNCLYGVNLQGQVRKNLTISYNDILLSTDANQYKHNDAFLFYVNPGSTNINIIGNHIGVDGDVPTVGVTYYFLDMFDIQGLNVAHNTVDPSFVNYMTGCSNVNIDDNYDSFGNYLTSLNTPVLGNTPVTSFGLNLIGSAGASPALTYLGLPSNPLLIVTNSELPQKFVSVEYPLTNNTTYFISTNHGLSGTPQFLRWVLVCKTNELGYVVGDEVSAAALVNSGDNSKHDVETANSTNVLFTFSVNGQSMQLPNKTVSGAPTTLANTSHVINNWKLKCYATYLP